MADLFETSEAFDWSISKIARAFGMSRETVSKRFQDAGLAPSKKRNGYPVYPLAQAGPALFETDQARSPEYLRDPESMLPKDRRDWYEGEKVRIALELQRGNLLTLDDYRAEMARILKQVAGTLETLPDILERKCALPPDAVLRAQEEIDKERALLVAALVDDEP